MSRHQLIKVPPTKNTLLELKKQVRFLEDGHALLERKRELLTRLVYERVGEYQQLRTETHAAIKSAYHWLGMAHLRMGSLQLIRLGESELALSRLMAEQRKAQKRVNALKYNIIPRYRDTIRYIESVLEEECNERCWLWTLIHKGYR